MPLEYRALINVSESLKLQLPPLAVSLHDEAPPGGVEFSGRVPAGCAFWELAGHAPILTSTVHHELCSIGTYTHNLSQPSLSYQSELKTVLQVLEEMQYVRPEDLAQIPVLKTSPKFVLYSPLDLTRGRPDVVMLFVQASQSLIISEAVQQIENGLPPAMGRPACAIIPQVVNTGRAALSLGCCGARAYLSILKDDIALWALPGRNIEEYVDRISILAKANETLTKFHLLRMQDVRDGRKPTYKESLARLQP